MGGIGTVSMASVLEFSILQLAGPRLASANFERMSRESVLTVPAILTTPAVPAMPAILAILAILTTPSIPAILTLLAMLAILTTLTTRTARAGADHARGGHQ